MDTTWDVDPANGREVDKGYKTKIKQLTDFLQGIADELHTKRHGDDRTSSAAKSNWERLQADIKHLKAKLADHKLGEKRTQRMTIALHHTGTCHPPQFRQT